MRFEFTDTAEGDYQKLPRSIQERVAKKIRILSEIDRPLRLAKHLKGFNVYRFRVGDYRIIGEVIKDTFYVLLIRRRDNAYRGL